MSRFWSVIFLCLAFSSTFSEARHHHHKQLPSAVVVGTVYCDTCFQQVFHKTSHFISGASVAVECKDTTTTKPSFRREVKTNEHGQFKVHLPSTVSKNLNNIKNCSVSLIRSNEPYCSVAADATSSSLHLKSRKQGTHIFSAGFFTFKPLNQPEICDQKPSINKHNDYNNDKLSPIQNPNDPAFPPPLQDPPANPPPLLGIIPPLPGLPTLPRLPPIPEIPLLPPGPKEEIPTQTRNLKDKKATQPTSYPFPIPPNTKSPAAANPSQVNAPTPSQAQNLKDKKVSQPAFPFPPNPFSPFPSNPFLPPNPFLPTPPPSVSSPATAPTASRPPIPKLPPLPPFPFQPIPGFPWVPPPAKVVAKKAP